MFGLQAAQIARPVVIIVVLVGLIPTLGSAEPATITGKVVAVADGDTLTVLDDQQQQVKIRLNGIDSPERKQAYGDKARKALSDRVFGKTITVKWTEKDRYGRTLGDVFIDGANVNLELVRNGWAWHYKQYSSDKALADAEVAARKEKKGLWADKAPIAPWEFRKQQRTKAKQIPTTRRN